MIYDAWLMRFVWSLCVLYCFGVIEGSVLKASLFRTGWRTKNFFFSFIRAYTPFSEEVYANIHFSNIKFFLVYLDFILRISGGGNKVAKRFNFIPPNSF